MKLIQTDKHHALFKVLGSTRSSQAAMMVLQPGEATGEPENEHPHSEQWLFVISGKGRARVKQRWVALKENALLLIQKGEVHQIVNNGKAPLVTLNFYAPPAYTKSGDLKD